MMEPLVTGTAPEHPLDPRLRDLLRQLPDAQASVLESLIRDRDRLVTLAERRAERLQRLHEVSVALTRSLDREEVERQLARQAARVLPCSGVVIARADGDGGAQLVLHWRDGAEAPLDGALITRAAVDEVAHTSRASRAVLGAAGRGRSEQVLAVPLTVGFRLTAVIAIYGGSNGFSAEDEDLLHTLGATAATALVNATLFAESLHERRQSEALAAVSGALSASLRIADVLRLSLRHSMAILGASGSSVALRRDEYLHLVATEGSADPIQGFYVPLAESASGRAMLEERTLVVNDASAVEGGYARTRDTASIRKLVSAPLLTPDGPIGILSVVNREADFTDGDARVLQRLASQLALALVNARLYEEASEATRELSTAFEAIAGGMAVVDSEGFIVRHNTRLSSLAGLGTDVSLRGRALYDVLLRVPQGLMLEDTVGTAVLGRVVGRGVIRVPWSSRLLQIVASPHPAGGAVVTVDDVTAERARDEALVRAEARYERLVESAEDAICTLDEEGHLTSANRALERVLGLARDQVLGKPFADLLGPSERTDKWRVFAATLSGKHQRSEVRFASDSGRVRMATVVTAPLYEDGRVSGVLAIFRDVTEERALMEKVVRSEKLAALGELVGGVAHEVNSPLTSILAFGQLLQDSTLDSVESHKALDTIVHEAKRAARIVGKFLSFARQHPTDKMDTDLNQVVLDTIELRRYPLKMQEILLETDLAPDLPLTWADPFQLQQVFINLLNNAEQALTGREGMRRITVSSRRVSRGIRVTVADTGSGIAPEHLPHIFNPFYTTKARGVGTGLGLSISFGIVRDHAGTLSAQSEPGRGAVFEVLLPITAPPLPTSS